MRFVLLAQSHALPSTLSCPEPTSKGDASGNRFDGRVEGVQCHGLIFKIPGFIAG